MVGDQHRGYAGTGWRDEMKVPFDTLAAELSDIGLAEDGDLFISGRPAGSRPER